MNTSIRTEHQVYRYSWYRVRGIWWVLCRLSRSVLKAREVGRECVDSDTGCVYSAKRFWLKKKLFGECVWGELFLAISPLSSLGTLGLQAELMDWSSWWNQLARTTTEETEACFREMVQYVSSQIEIRSTKIVLTNMLEDGWKRRVGGIVNDVS